MAIEMTSFDASKITKQGFVEKRGGQVKNWKKRLFVISQNNLYYFKDQEMKEMQGEIPLIDTVITDEDATEGPGFYFALRFPPTSKAARSEYLLRTSTSEEREDWKKAIILANKITVFGRPLMNGLRVNPDNFGQLLPIPYFIKSAIEYLNLTSLDVEGVYRLNGSQSQIESFQNLINDNKHVNFSDTHSTTGLIKLYLRTLPDPLFMKANYQQLKQISTLTDEEKQVDGIKKILRSLPISKFILIHFLFKHLRELSKHAEKTKMDPRNIAVCIGPTIISCDEDTTSGAYGESNVQQCIGILMLKYFDTIFGEQPLLRYKSNSSGRMCKITTYVANKYPYVLNAPTDSVVQVVAEDGDGWCVCVYNDKWGVLHTSQITEVTDSNVLLKGLATQDKKWELSESELQELSKKCPEAVQLYEAMKAKLNEYRGIAKRY